MKSTARLTIGTRVCFEDHIWTVAGLAGTDVQLARAGAAPFLTDLRVLLAAPGFSVAGDEELDEPEALGPMFSSLTRGEYAQLQEKEGHVLEILTGYRTGEPTPGRTGEPRPAYDPVVPKMARYEAKAKELGVSVPTIRRMVARYEHDGIAGLVDSRSHRASNPLGRVDARWVATALNVLDEHVGASQPTRRHIIDITNARATFKYPDLKPPSAETARRVLVALTHGKAAFTGASAKQKRSISTRPATPYGKLRALRFGEFILLDTTPLDVHAMDPTTLRWVNLQLTVAMDLASRSITGLRLSHISGNAVDAALVLFETLDPTPGSDTSVGILPYSGIPEIVFGPWDPGSSGEADPIRPAKPPTSGPAGEGDSARRLPSTAIDTVFVDHGKMYMSEHVRSVCQRFGISIQPARKMTPTDKAPLERFFRTLREDLLGALPGYKGPDVYSRGEKVEDRAFYFSDELEAIIREWIVTRYHRSVHRGLKVSETPGLDLCPDEMREVLIARGAAINVPRRADMVFDFLPTAWREIHHYGVQVANLRYDGPGLEGFRGTSSPYARKRGLWPLRYDPDDARTVYFQRPDDLRWHKLTWVDADAFPVPFSFETLRCARRLAGTQNRHPDRHELLELLERWDAGAFTNPSERRVALRLSEQRAARLSFDSTGALRETEGAQRATPRTGLEGGDDGVDAAGLPVEDTGESSTADHQAGGAEETPAAAGPPETDAADDEDDDATGGADFYFGAFEVGE